MFFVVFYVDLEMNGELYSASPFSAKEFTVPGASVLRLNVTGLDSIRVTRADDSTSDAQAAAVVCAGRTGASGYCTDLEPLHSTDIRSVKIDVSRVVNIVIIVIIIITTYIRLLLIVILILIVGIILMVIFTINKCHD